MPPKVERTRPEVPLTRDGYFFLDLASSESFDVSLFDETAKILKNFLRFRDTDEKFSLKWMVLGQRMYFFAPIPGHFARFQEFRKNGDTSPLLSAGELEMEQRENGYHRAITECSDTLIGEGLLKRAESDKYKLQELPKLLNAEGEFFNFS